MTAPRSIGAQQNLPTAFEVAIYVDGALDRVVAYTAKRTKGSLQDICVRNGDYILTILTEEEADAAWNYSKATGVVFGNGKVRVDFTGYTERDAAQKIGKLK